MVTLLTDFGVTDEYVGVMKGVILSIHPSAQVVDLCHEIPPGDIVRGSWLLAWAWRYFPASTIHVAVVDPGVGSSRRILCASVGGHLFLAPDNGLLSGILSQAERPCFWEVRNRRYFRPEVSRTFHGRDIFAPVAGHLSSGLRPAQLGPPARPSIRLRIPKPARNRNRVLGEVIQLDRFGNAVTNLPGGLLEKWAPSLGGLECWVGDKRIPGIRRSYSAVPIGETLAVVGSRGLLEISVHRGSAAKQLRLSVGDPVEVRRRR